MNERTLQWSPLARVMGLQQIETWANQVRSDQLSQEEFTSAKRRKLGDIGLDATTPLTRVDTSPMAQATYLDVANAARTYVRSGLLTEEEYALLRRILLYECGILD